MQNKVKKGKEISPFHLFSGILITYLQDRGKAHVFASFFGTEKIYLLYIFAFLLTFNRSPEAMKAATEEVNKTLENAGQKISFDDKPICLNQMQLNDMPVLGMHNLLHYISFTASY